MKAEPKAEAAASSPKKKLLILIAAAVLVIGAGSGAAAWFLTKDSAASTDKKEHKSKKAEPPEYVALEQFVVNLAPENGDQYLQAQITLQVANLEQVESIKANMAKVRNRVLLLLSSKKASEIATVDGKKTLATEIKTAINEPFVDKGEAQEVTDVLFTSFIIQ